MMLTTTNFGPGLTAEIDYRRERNIAAGQGRARSKRGTSRRVWPASVRRAGGRVGAALPAR